MAVVDWLMDSDPAIRWQVMRDLLGSDDEAVAAERARIADEGWGARLLALQDADGQWAGGTYFPPVSREPEDQPWTATAFTLQLLRQFGIDPGDERVRRAVALVRENSRWEYDGSRFFDGEVEPCINGMTVAIGAYFGEDVTGIVERLLTETLDDGGWNCEAEFGSTRSSFNSTISVLEGLLEYETRMGASPEITTARERAHAYLLDRHLMRRLSTGEIVDDRWLRFSFPVRWHYDVLRSLDYLRAAGVTPDDRLAEAIDLVESKRQADGTWLLDHTHQGAVHFELDDGDGRPSRWNTLRALRVLEWYRA
ncbi:hypothetical protein [Diaminobutyricibacter sp. McL0608]|uniref:hypothetical protein n=1 Tax=Leifsonia sp. McL0608 TaxID=3143537 RepID=UPI0031F3368B